MSSRRARSFVGAGVLSLLAVPMAVVGEGRKNTRDFPDGTLCALNPGWDVDIFSGELIEPKILRPPVQTFVAGGTDAEVSLVACDGGLQSDDLSDFGVVIRDFAVVRKDVYDSHQAAANYPHVPGETVNTCYFARDFEAQYVRLVGSVFDASVAPAVKPLSARLPFFDDFSDLKFSQRRWRLDGATLEDVLLNDPRLEQQFTGRALVLARIHTDQTQNRCSMARVKVRHLQKDQTYVVDYKWQPSGTQSPVPDTQVLTFVDTNP